MPNKEIHEQQGLRIWQNERNGFVVARLHFTADPRKRSPEWIEASKRGMSRAKWEQEFDINYAAQMGEKAFPEILSRREQIVTKEGPYIEGAWPTDIHMWGGLDYGVKNPTSFHVYTVVDGVTYALWELYAPCKNITDLAKALKDCPYYNQIRYIVHDPSMCERRSHTQQGDVTSVKAHLEALGITKLVIGNQDEAGWIAQMAKHWCGLEVTFKILSCCPHMIDEFEGATYASMTDRQLETQNYREALIDRHNHSLDDCKYFMNSGASRVKSKPLRIPSMVASYGWSGGSADGIPRYRQGELGLVV